MSAIKETKAAKEASFIGTAFSIVLGAGAIILGEDLLMDPPQNMNEQILDYAYTGGGALIGVIVHSTCKPYRNFVENAVDFVGNGFKKAPAQKDALKI